MIALFMNIPATIPNLLALIKCSGDPLINVGGAYFPSWLACMFLGIFGTWIVAVLLIRFNLSELLQPQGIMFPAFFALITLWSWMFFFAAR